MTGAVTMVYPGEREADLPQELRLHSKCLLNASQRKAQPLPGALQGERKGQASPASEEEKGVGRCWQRRGVRSPGFLILCHVKSFCLSVTQFSHLANGEKLLAT